MHERVGDGVEVVVELDVVVDVHPHPLPLGDVVLDMARKAAELARTTPLGGVRRAGLATRGSFPSSTRQRARGQKYQQKQELKVPHSPEKHSSFTKHDCTLAQRPKSTKQ